MNGICEGCGETSWLIPLHGGKGGPLRCPICAGKWNAEHGRRRRTGRIAIRAIKAFLDAGGKYQDIDKLKFSATSGVFGDHIVDQLGYMDGIARFDDADVELTSELLADVLRLTHPDCHPPERQELAHRVTQGLLALQPFVFPAPKPEPPTKLKPTPRSRLDDLEKDISSKKTARYPCSDCADTVLAYYCDACRTEYEKREQAEFERRTAKQRAEHARRRARMLAKRPLAHCAECGKVFNSKRDDARFCSERCRQRAHRKAVTEKPKHPESLITYRDSWERKLLALLARHRAVFLNDLLPEQRTRAQYQALCLLAAKLEAAGKIESFSYLVQWGKPGFKVLVKPGHEIEHPDKVRRLKANERLPLSA
jgi:hypothetical protein